MTADCVYILLHQDLTTAAVVAVFTSLCDANVHCLGLAAQAGIRLEQPSPTCGPDGQSMTPLEPLRWDTADGVSCWVEQHAVRGPNVVPPRSDSRHLLQTASVPSVAAAAAPAAAPSDGDVVVDRKCFPRDAAQSAPTERLL
jgi:hypothetical protein